MKQLIQVKALDLVEETLRRKQKETKMRKYTYFVPTLWRSETGSARKTKVNPFAYYLSVVTAIKRKKAGKRGKSTGGEWTRDAVIYNMFIRTTAAFDHNGNGTLDLPVNSEGFRETGTFLKAIVMLPYIKRLGANTVHLLPITSIGHDGNKGTLGSPYAIRNPYELDENLSEPSLGLDAKTEFKAFVEAAHRLGLRVVLEFVFRTAAKDADWVKEHPEWMYWIKEGVKVREPNSSDESRYGSPIFTPDELGRIHHAVNEKRFADLLPPHQKYRDFFTKPPSSDQVQKKDGRYVGKLDDGTLVKIPGAFADWPPDDSQPPWGDVTYLRLYTHPDFNYIGYNTIRMYDSRLTQPQYINRPLWDRIVGIIPYYQREFLIDGVMIDMGHALPMELKSEMVNSARGVDPDFAFWDENFSITQKSRDEGYNAVFGYLWTDEHRPDKMKSLVRHLAHQGFPIPFFATPENHNTPRAAARPGGLAYAKWALVVNAFLPAVPFIHSGFELGGRFPINTGLDFTPEQLRHFPSEKLPLFSEGGYDWESQDQFVGLVKKVMLIRSKVAGIVTDPHPTTFAVLEDSNERILAFARIARGSRKKVAVVGNFNYIGNEEAFVKLDTPKKTVTDLLTGKKLPVRDHHIQALLAPGGSLVFEF